MTKKTFMKYHALARASVMTEQEIRSWLKVLRDISSEKEHQKVVLELDKVFTFPKALTQEQTQKGLEWMRRACFKINGEPRKTTPFYSMYLKDIKKILDNFDRWELTDLSALTGAKYAMIAKDGTRFEYYVNGTRVG